MDLNWYGCEQDVAMMTFNNWKQYDPPNLMHRIINEWLFLKDLSE